MKDFTINFEINNIEDFKQRLNACKEGIRIAQAEGDDKLEQEYIDLSEYLEEIIEKYNESSNGLVGLTKTQLDIATETIAWAWFARKNNLRY